MYLKRDRGPVSVPLPDGSIMTRSDLPPVNTTRWVASRKAAVVKGVAAGLLTGKEACQLYDLSEEELESWASAVKCFGIRALKATRIKEYRQL